MKNYKIITLGASGSGKTVFLSSMFRSLGIQSDHGFYLQVKGFKQQRRLNAIYTEIITGDIWPKGTRYSEISEWNFICRVKNDSELEDYSVCEFSYFDYSGGRLTDSQEEDTEFREIIKQSDIILGLIDGQKIHALMNNTNQELAKSFLDKDLPSMIKWMSGCRKPIHFILTKWDLLQDDYLLKQIIHHLLQIPIFEDLVYERNQANSPVRLIPVSSVGQGFATLNLDGSMKKMPGVYPHPFQVEVPISYILPDEFQSTLLELAEKRGKLKNQPAGNIFQKLAKFVPLGGDVVIEGAFNIIPEIITDIIPGGNTISKAGKSIFKMSKPIFAKVISGLDVSTKSIEELKQEQQTSLQLVKDEETALSHAIDCFTYIQLKFEKDFPESKIIVLS